MIYFVGAGPGAVDLITVRGERLLKAADVIIYAGSLVNPALLQNVKPDCEIFNSAEMTLKQVVDKLIASEQAGKMTVRLQTGDPSIYGAIREQMDELDKHGISYEVVPGVSSLFGAASALNAEYTLPGVSQTVIITRAEGRTPVPEKESIKLLSSHGATMAIFLSAGLLDKLTEDLLAGGYSKDCPAAIVYKATWPDEKIIRTVVSRLSEDAKREKISQTALILVGGFLGDNYDRSLLYSPEFTHGYRKGTADEV